MSNQYSSKDLSHHGIVSVVCDQIRLVEIIDQIIPPDPRAEITTGEAVKLMVINGLGFSSRPLYLESQFFESKPIHLLLNRDIECSQITDDRLGRCLDRCFESGCSQIFSRVATKAALQYNVDRKFRHLDTTSMNVNGEYAEEDGIGLVQFGYSKDKRSDLKQFMISLISSKDGDVPLLAQTIAGNTSDKTHFKDVLNSLKDQMDPQGPAYYVADSAMYTGETIKEISSQMMWISRVPEALKAAKNLISQVSPEDMQIVNNGYRVFEVGNYYSGVQQRWLVVFSQQAYEREVKTLDRQINKELKEKKQELRHLSSNDFCCPGDALRAVTAFENKLKYHRCADVKIVEKRVAQGRGRPNKDAAHNIVYMVNASIGRSDHEINEALKKKGKFIVATNELDADKLSNTELLDVYKGQQCVERGFRFLKDPLFMTSSVFLKKQERIVALGMIMCLCLLVYSLAQRFLRIRMRELKTTLLDQKGKPSTQPTMRWIFQVFEGVHLLSFREAGGTRQIILNLTPERLRILEVLGHPFQKIYGNAI
jgi:transposase